MSDLNGIQATEATRLVGSDSSGQEQTPVQSTSNGELLVADIVVATGTQAALSVGTTAVEVKVGVSPLTGRKIVTVYNNSNTAIYWGRNSSVTTATGTPIESKQLMVFEGFSASQAIYLIAGSAGNNTRITES